MAASCVEYQPINHQNQCAEGNEGLRVRFKWFSDVLIVKVDVNGYFLVWKVAKFRIALPDGFVALELHLLDLFNWVLNLKRFGFFPVLIDCDFCFQFLIFIFGVIAQNLVGFNKHCVMRLVNLLFFIHHSSYLTHKCLIKKTNRPLSLILLEFSFDISTWEKWKRLVCFTRCYINSDPLVYILTLQLFQASQSILNLIKFIIIELQLVYLFLNFLSAHNKLVQPGVLKNS